MKALLPVPALLLTLLSALVLANCASAPPYEESVLVQAGFQPVVPETVTERNAYDAMPAYKLTSTDAPGRPAYAYRDQSKKVTYIGGEMEYRRYQELIQKTGTERSNQIVAQMNQDAVHSFR